MDAFIKLFLVCGLVLTCQAWSSKVPSYSKRPSDLLYSDPKLLVDINKTVAVIVFDATLPVMQFVVDGQSMYEEVLGYDKEEAEKFRNEALKYFEETFGFGPNERGLALTYYETNPKVNMTCIFLTGEEIPPEGLKVRDGGWMVTVMNPSGVKLKGKFKGEMAKVGTTFSYGHWVIMRENGPPITWLKRHSAPGGVMEYDPGTKRFTGEMHVFSDELGIGEAIHSVKYTILDKGRKAEAKFRNVITFDQLPEVFYNKQSKNEEKPATDSHDD